MRFEQEKKLHELIEEKQKCIASGADTITIQRLKEAIEDCRANIEIIQSRSLLLILSYLSEEDMDYFLERYKSGEVEKILTEILISSEIHAIAEEAGFTVRYVLKIDEAEFNEVKQIMKDMNVLPALDNTWHRSPIYENWKRYVLDNVPNIHHARYLIEQFRFDPVFNMLRQEEFFYPAFVSYWHQKENLYSLPPTVTKATQYTIMYHFQINCKEHDLDKDRAWSSLQERFQEFGKLLYDNISEESVGKFSTSWFDSGIIGTELHGLVENCGDYYCFNSLFVYAYIIACYVCADIKSGGKCLDQLMEEDEFNFYQEKLPFLYFYISGILGGHAEIASLRDYTESLLKQENDVHVRLERLGYCLLESNRASELAADDGTVIMGQQTLDLSKCTAVSNQSLHAFAAVIQNTSIIQEVVIHSERERNTFSSEFKECVDRFSSDDKTTKELSIVIRDQHEFISFVKLLRALPILKCFHNKSESVHCYIPDMQSVKVTATFQIDHVDQDL
ncbi:uncharacterized protein [Ptychodera flava]|uniref:uncharacterized protein n=1 Tax=Ptychodera flava TaxID=63121 RepID=UPI00396A3060